MWEDFLDYRYVCRHFCPWILKSIYEVKHECWISDLVHHKGDWWDQGSVWLCQVILLKLVQSCLYGLCFVHWITIMQSCEHRFAPKKNIICQIEKHEMFFSQEAFLLFQSPVAVCFMLLHPILSQMFVRTDCRTRCLIWYTSGDGTEWNTWIQWLRGVDQCFCPYSLF